MFGGQGDEDDNSAEKGEVEEESDNDEDDDVRFFTILPKLLNLHEIMDWKYNAFWMGKIMHWVD